MNRLATILTVNIKPGTVEPIDEPDVEKALQYLLEESNDHFDNLYEKAKLYKETFVEIVFDHVEYYPDDEDQSWLKQYGLIKKKDGKAKTPKQINSLVEIRYIMILCGEEMERRDIVFTPNVPLSRYYVFT